MKRILRYMSLVAIQLLLTIHGFGQDTITADSAAKDTAKAMVGAADTVAATSVSTVAAAPDTTATAIGDPGFNRIIPGTPFSMLQLLLVGLFVVGVLGFVLMILLERYLQRQSDHTAADPSKEDLQERLEGLQSTVRTLRWIFGVGMAVFMIGFFIQQQIKGTTWEGHINEWLNLVVRWAHITFGVAWIGASFYFIFLENALYRGPGIREGLAGNLWAIHGGGFYYVEKYKVAPE